MNKKYENTDADEIIVQNTNALTYANLNQQNNSTCNTKCVIITDLLSSDQSHFNETKARLGFSNYLHNNETSSNNATFLCLLLH